MSLVVTEGTYLDYDSVYDFLPLLIEKITPIWEENAQMLSMRLFTAVYDGQCDHGNPPRATWRTANNEFEELSETLKNRLLSFKLYFGESPRKRLLAYPMGNITCISAFHSIPGVHDFSYHGGADVSDSDPITKAEWEERYEEWDAMMDSHGSLDSLPAWTLPRRDDIFLPMIVNLEWREKMLAQQPSPLERAQAILIHELCKATDEESIKVRTSTTVHLMGPEKFGDLPRPITFKDLHGSQRTDYKLPAGLVEETQRKIQKSF